MAEHSKPHSKPGTARPRAARRPPSIALLSLALLTACGGSEEGLDGSWAAAPPMQTPRGAHAAVRLDDGRVLVSGGIREQAKTEAIRTATAELYDPRQNLWQGATDMGWAHVGHSMAKLGDGSALLVGSEGDERYSPEQGTWAKVEGRKGTESCGALSLPDGSALSVGDAGGPVAQRFDPATGQWKPLSPPSAGRRDCKLLLLASGEVMVLGGNTVEAGKPTATGKVEIYDPAADAWRPAASLDQVFVDDAVSLPDGRVLALRTDERGAQAELWSPSTGRWSKVPAPLGEKPEVARGGLVPHPAGALVFLSNTFYTPPVQRFDAETEGWTQLNSPSAAASLSVATLLADGRVLVTGGTVSLPTDRAEVMTP